MVVSGQVRYQLSAHKSYVKDEPIIINFTIENISREKVWVLKWYTPLEGVKGKIFHVLCDGKEIPYEGLMMKRGEPTNDDYIQIDQGSSVSAEIDLSKVYNIPVCAECVVDFKGQIYDITTSFESVPRSSDKQQIVDVEGNNVIFSVIGS